MGVPGLQLPCVGQQAESVIKVGREDLSDGKHRTDGANGGRARRGLVLRSAGPGTGPVPEPAAGRAPLRGRRGGGKPTGSIFAINFLTFRAKHVRLLFGLARGRGGRRGDWDAVLTGRRRGVL